MRNKFHNIIAITACLVSYASVSLAQQGPTPKTQEECVNLMQRLQSTIDIFSQKVTIYCSFFGEKPTFDFGLCLAYQKLLRAAIEEQKRLVHICVPLFKSDE